MDFRNLRVEVAEGIAAVTISRPEALNALNQETLLEMERLFAALATDKEVGCVILSGAGEKAFVAGADIAAMQPMDFAAAREFARLGHRVLSLIEILPVPVIAAVNGFALGGGCELALACDLRVASENARFGQPEVNLGIIPGFGGTQRLPRLIGKGRAKELLFTGGMIDAREAFRLGLVNRVVLPEELPSAAREMAEKILAKGPAAVRLAKEAVNNGLEMSLEQACRYETDLFALCFATADQKEGMTAFLEKRAAQFRGE